jgi:multiple sugar transport system ATP-binding protein
MVFQNYALYPHMTVYQNIAFSLRIRHVPPAEVHRRVLEVAAALGIEDLLQRKPKALSGGQRQRAALGRAMIRQPNLFLFDEPLSNLDAKLRSQMRAEIKRLHRRLNTTFIYVTHDQVEAMTMADRMVVMQDGRIQQVGTPAEIYLHPANLFVAGFVGSPQMNIFPARLTMRGDMLGLEVKSDAFLPLPHLKLTAEAKELVGQGLTAGIRPECVEVTPKVRPGSLLAEVEFAENLGKEQLIYCSLQGEPIMARTTAGMLLPAGATVGLQFAAEQIHLFDPTSQLALQLPTDLTPLGSGVPHQA